MRIPAGHRGGLLALFALAWIIRLGAASLFVGLDAPPDAEGNPDQVDYEQFAWSLASGNGYTLVNGEPTARRPPGTSLALAPVYCLFGRNHAAGRIWFTFLSAITCLLTAALGVRIGGSGLGLAAGTWLALYPGHIKYSVHFLSEVPFTLALLVGSLGMLGMLRHGRWRDVILFALAMGFGILTRPQMAFLYPLALLLILIRGRAQRPRLVFRLVVAGGLVAFIVGPWMLRNAVVLGKPTLSTIGGYTFWGAHNQLVVEDPRTLGSWIRVNELAETTHPLPEDEVTREEATWRYGWEFVAANRSLLPRLLAFKLIRLFSPFEYTPNRLVYWGEALAWMLTGPLSLWGLLVVCRRDRNVFHTLFHPILATIFTSLLFYGSTRFRNSIAPVLCLLAALALQACWQWWRRRSTPASAPA